MKNIHVLPTDKSSRLVKGETTGRLLLHNTYGTSTDRNKTQNIYITSDEEIKEGDWFLVVGGVGLAINTYHKSNGDTPKNDWLKKIILTTDLELQKDGVQSIDDEFLEWFVKNPSCEEVIVTNLYGDYNPIEYFYEIIIPKEEPKQETLEEAAERHVNINVAKNLAKLMYKEHFIEGAKWQQDKICNSEVLQRIRASKSDAEARRIIKTI